MSKSGWLIGVLMVPLAACGNSSNSGTESPAGKSGLSSALVLSAASDAQKLQFCNWLASVAPADACSGASASSQDAGAPVTDGGMPGSSDGGASAAAGGEPASAAAQCLACCPAPLCKPQRERAVGDRAGQCTAGSLPPQAARGDCGCCGADIAPRAAPAPARLDTTVHGCTCSSAAAAATGPGTLGNGAAASGTPRLGACSGSCTVAVAEKGSDATAPTAAA